MRAAAVSRVARMFDTQTVTIVPRRQGFDTTSQPAADPERQPFTRAATVELAPQAPDAARKPAGDPGSRGQVSYAAVMTADTNDWPYLPKRLVDLVTIASGQMAGRSFTVQAVEDDASGRPAFYLSPAG